MAVIGRVDRDWLERNAEDNEFGDDTLHWGNRHLDRYEAVAVRHWNVSDAAVERGETRCPHVDRNRHWTGDDTEITEPLSDCHPNCHTVYRVVLFEGRVLSEYEVNGYHDSDFYAVVWDGEAIRDYMWGTTRCASTGWNCRIDATDETKAAARVYLERVAYEDAVALAEDEARKPIKGRRVRSWRGRKHEAIEGTIFWTGEFKTGYSDWTVTRKVGIETDDGERVFVPEDRAEVIDPEPVDLDRCRAIAAKIAADGRWRRADRGWYGR